MQPTTNLAEIAYFQNCSGVKTTHWVAREAWFRLRYRPYLVRLYQDNGLRQAVAERVADDCVDRLLKKKILRFDPALAEGGFRGWLKTVVKREAIDELVAQIEDSR